MSSSSWHMIWQEEDDRLTDRNRQQERNKSSICENNLTWRRDMSFPYECRRLFQPESIFLKKSIRIACLAEKRNSCSLLFSRQTNGTPVYSPVYSSLPESRETCFIDFLPFISFMSCSSCLMFRENNTRRLRRQWINLSLTVNRFLYALSLSTWTAIQQIPVLRCTSMTSLLPKSTITSNTCSSLLDPPSKDMYRQLLTEHQVLQKSHSSLCEKVVCHEDFMQNNDTASCVSKNNSTSRQDKGIFRSKIHKLNDRKECLMEQMAASLPFLPQEEDTIIHGSQAHRNNNDSKSREDDELHRSLEHRSLFSSSSRLDHHYNQRSNHDVHPSHASHLRSSIDDALHSGRKRSIARVSSLSHLPLLLQNKREHNSVNELKQQVRDMTWSTEESLSN